jgi:putative transposase
MPKKGHSEEQIVAALQHAEVGGKVADICRKMSISPATFHTWKRQYSGLGISELQELRQLRDENLRLKRLVADLSLDQQILQKIVSKELYSLVYGGSWPVGQRKATKSAGAGG